MNLRSKRAQNCIYFQQADYSCSCILQAVQVDNLTFSLIFNLKFPLYEYRNTTDKNSDGLYKWQQQPMNTNDALDNQKGIFSFNNKERDKLNLNLLFFFMAHE